MKKTVVLFKPRPYKKDSFEDKTICAYIPLSLLALASPLQKEGYRVVIFDEKFDDDIERKMLALRENIITVGITAQTGYEIVGGLRISKFAKEVLRVPTVWGGWHASTTPRQTIENPYVDYVVKGQGLQTIIELVEALTQGSTINDIRGIVYKKNDTVVETPNRDIVDINRYPMPSYDLIDIEKYIEDVRKKGMRITNSIHIKRERSIIYYSSAGCVYRCGFCSNNFLSGGKVTMLKAETVGEQLEYLVERYNVEFIQFVDASFFVYTDRVKKICQEIINRKLPIHYGLGGPRVDQIIRWDDTVLSLLKDSGCIWLGVGSESGSQKMLDYMKKGIRSSDIMKSAIKIHRSGIDMAFFFLFGLPTDETKEDLFASFRLAAQLKALYPEILLPMYFYDSYPGTPLYYDAIKRGFKEPKTLEAWGDYTPEVTRENPLATYVMKQYVDLVKRVIIFYLPLAYPGDMVLGTFTYIKSRLKKSRLKYILRFLHLVAKQRVKAEWYDFPIEWEIFKFLMRLMPNKFYKH